MRPYPTKPDDQIEILLPSYQRQIPAHEKKNLKSVIPEVFSKLAQDQDHEVGLMRFYFPVLSRVLTIFTTSFLIARFQNYI